MDATLRRFIKNECANYDRHYGVCITGENCLVETGKRCGYFEKTVLGPPDYKFKLPNIDYQKIYSLYADATETKTEKVTGNQCECGINLPPRKKMCEKCRINRRRKTKREYQHKFRQSSTVGVNQGL